jgi:Cof subfamily protein (haloacid dehalogenase superfamily)
MKTSNPKAIFLDIDGTLLWYGLGPFASDLSALVKAHNAGHFIFLSTGRSLANTPHILLYAPYIDGFVLAAGAHVIVKGAAIYSKTVDAKTACEICAYYLGTNKWCVFEGETGIFTVNSAEFSLFPPNAMRTITSADDFLTKYKDERVSKITIQGKISPNEEKFLRGAFEIHTFPPDYFEGIIKGHNKMRGIQLVLDELKLSRENSIAIGDSHNDMDMVTGCGLGIAMGNACQELKDAAKAVTLDCLDGGVGAALQKYIFHS